MTENNFFDHKDYPTIMFLAITFVSILLLFNFVNFIEEIDKGITAYAIQNQEENKNITPTVQEVKEEELISKPISPEPEIEENELEGEMYTTFAWGIFYIIILAIIVLFAILSITLKNTVNTNIIEENSSGGFLK